MLELPPLTLYIHYPWCVKKCPYCDFNSHEGSQQNGYLQALVSDLEASLEWVQGRPIDSIFIGGGTPSLMSIDMLEILFFNLQRYLVFTQDIEITLEANPAAIEVQKFRYFKQLGINRLSIGVQSFNNQYLKFLGRIHSKEEAIYAIENAKKIGFSNLNIDLMYGLKQQSVDACLVDIQKAIQLEPNHISFYQLTIEPNTLFAKYPPKLPHHDSIWKMGKEGATLLEYHGFGQYEVSAYGKPSKHNLNYWRFGDYIGIGAGAHGKLTDIKAQRVFRTTKIKSPKDFINTNHQRTKPVDDIVFEFMLNALRLKRGFSMDLFERRTGLSIQTIQQKLAKSQKLGLLQIKRSHIKPSDKGYDFLNNLQAVFMR